MPDFHSGKDNDSDATTESTGEDDLFLNDVAEDDKPFGYCSESAQIAYDERILHDHLRQQHPRYCCPPNTPCDKPKGKGNKLVRF